MIEVKLNKTFLIGNGFDLNLGLKTSYEDFFRYVLKNCGNDKEIKNNSIFQLIKKGYSKEKEFNNWSDFEESLHHKLVNLQEHFYSRDTIIVTEDIVTNKSPNIDDNYISEKCIQISDSNKTIDFDDYIEKYFSNDYSVFLEYFRKYIENNIDSNIIKNYPIDKKKEFIENFINSLFMYVKNLRKDEKKTILEKIFRDYSIKKNSNRTYRILGKGETNSGESKVNKNNYYYKENTLILNINYEFLVFNYTKVIEENIVKYIENDTFNIIINKFEKLISDEIYNMIDELSEEQKLSICGKKIPDIKVKTNLRDLKKLIHNVHIGENNHYIMGLTDRLLIPDIFLKRVFCKLDYIEDRDYIDQKLIKTDIFYIFGMSLGLGDSMYWKNIIRELIRGAVVILNIHDSEFRDNKKHWTPLDSDIKSSFKKKELLNYADDLEKESREELADNIWLDECRNYLTFELT